MSGLALPDASFELPRVSPDVQSLAVGMSVSTAAKIWIYGLTCGGGMRQLSTNITAVRCVGFAPGGDLQGIRPIARYNRARRSFAPARTRTIGEAMHGSGVHAQVLFGLSPLWVATWLFVGSYLVIMSDRVNRAIVIAVVIVGFIT